MYDSIYFIAECRKSSRFHTGYLISQTYHIQITIYIHISNNNYNNSKYSYSNTDYSTDIPVI